MKLLKLIAFFCLSLLFTGVTIHGGQSNSSGRVNNQKEYRCIRKKPDNLEEAIIADDVQSFLKYIKAWPDKAGALQCCLVEDAAKCLKHLLKGTSRKGCYPAGLTLHIIERAEIRADKCNNPKTARIYRMLLPYKKRLKRLEERRGII